MLEIDLNGKNKYYTLYSHIRGEILRGRIAAGEKLPSKRALAARLCVSVETVRLAYEQLLAEGYIASKERSGYYVEQAEAPAPAAAIIHKKAEREQKPAYALDLVRGTVPASLFPFSTWARLMRTVILDCGEHLLERVPCDGDYELKSEIANYLYRSRGIDVSPEYIVIGAGAEHLYGVIVQLLGRDNLYAVENPGYGKISSAYALNGARVAHVDVTENGMSVDGAREVGAQVFHVSPSHQFPTGAVMPVSARMKLIALATEQNGYVIEDDYDSEFRLTGKPLQCMYSLCPERVIYLNTFSKSLAPSMRMGYMALPPKLYEKYMRLFSHSANIAPLFEQKTLAAMLKGGYFERHLSRLRNNYRAVRKKLTEKLVNPHICRVFDTGSGAHFVVKAESADDETIKKSAAEHNINIRCINDYMPAPNEKAQGFAVINYSSLTEQKIDEFFSSI